MEPLLHIVIIWRRDANHLKYEWLPHGWVEVVQDDRIWNETRRHLEKTIQRLLRATEALPYAAVVGELADEHAQVCIHNHRNILYDLQIVIYYILYY